MLTTFAFERMQLSFSVCLFHSLFLSFLSLYFSACLSASPAPTSLFVSLSLPATSAYLFSSAIPVPRGWSPSSPSLFLHSISPIKKPLYIISFTWRLFLLHHDFLKLQRWLQNILGQWCHKPNVNNQLKSDLT